MNLENLIFPPDIFLYESCTQTQVQLIQFFLSVLYGIPIGAAIDIIRAARRKIKHNLFFSAAENILCFIGYVFFMECFCYIFSQGVFRVFFVFANFMGFIMWEFTLSRYYINILSFIFVIIDKFVNLCTGKARIFVRKVKK